MNESSQKVVDAQRARTRLPMVTPNSRWPSGAKW
jgi:hypothetical protein